jgi:hypothetical protein
MDERPAAAHPDDGRPRARVRDRFRRFVSGCARPGPACAGAASGAGATRAAAPAAAAASAAATPPAASTAAAATSAAASTTSPASPALATAAASATSSSAASGAPATFTDPYRDASGHAHSTSRRNDRRHGRRDLIVRRVVAQFRGRHLRARRAPGTTASTCRPRGLVAGMDLDLRPPPAEADDPEVRSLEACSGRVPSRSSRTGLPAGGPLPGQGPRRHEPSALPRAHRGTSATPWYLRHSRTNASRPQGAGGDEARDLEA